MKHRARTRHIMTCPKAIPQGPQWSARVADGPRPRQGPARAQRRLLGQGVTEGPGENQWERWGTTGEPVGKPPRLLSAWGARLVKGRLA